MVLGASVKNFFSRKCHDQAASQSLHLSCVTVLRLCCATLAVNDQSLSQGKCTCRLLSPSSKQEFLLDVMAVAIVAQECFQSPD